jgi:hypothetical protein
VLDVEDFRAFRDFANRENISKGKSSAGTTLDRLTCGNSFWSDNKRALKARTV